MRYQQSDGRWVYIDRDTARKIDQRDGRERLKGEAPHAFSQWVASLNGLIIAMDELEPRFRKEKILRFAKCAIYFTRRVKNDMSKRITVEQICALQHNTDNTYVTLQHAATPDGCIVDQNMLSKLVACARGDLKDETGNRCDCTNCMACMDRSAWQNCELYHILLTLDCAMVENELDDPTICPFGIGGGVDGEI